MRQKSFEDAHFVVAIVFFIVVMTVITISTMLQVDALSMRLRHLEQNGLQIEIHIPKPATIIDHTYYT